MLHTKAFAYSSYQHQCDQELLEHTSAAIYDLKREAQAYDEGWTSDLQPTIQARENLARILRGLADRIIAVTGSPYQGDRNLTFAGVANRYATTYANDLSDRLATLARLCRRLETPAILRPPDFQVLDDLQTVLEEEVSTHVSHLFRF